MDKKQKNITTIGILSLIVISAILIFTNIWVEGPEDNKIKYYYLSGHVDDYELLQISVNPHGFTIDGEQWYFNEVYTLGDMYANNTINIGQPVNNYTNYIGHYVTIKYTKRSTDCCTFKHLYNIWID